ncbi:MAG: hypothetical protein ACYDBW_09105, partial [Sulfuricaulis sp.]
MNVEWMGTAYPADRFTQTPDMPGQEIVVAAPQQGEREEVRSARMPGASIVGHGTMISFPAYGAIRFAIAP